MFKKTITYKDYNGTERTEPFYFHLNATDLFDIQLTADHGDFESMLKTIIADRDGKKIMTLFSQLIRRAYGVKSDDGKQFIKNEEVVNAFCQSPAYDELFLELVTDAKKAADFVNALIPKETIEKLKNMKQPNPEDLPEGMKLIQ